METYNNSSGSSSSSQGEHIFNAVNDLVEKIIVGVLNRSINPHGDSTKVLAAQHAIRALSTSAAELKRARDDRDFRSASIGDPLNSIRFSQFAISTTSAIADIVSRNPSMHTRGYTSINRLINDLKERAIDRIAHTNARAQLSSARQMQFDRWYKQTAELMYATYQLLRDTALVVNRTWID